MKKYIILVKKIYYILYCFVIKFLSVFNYNYDGKPFKLIYISPYTIKYANTTSTIMTQKSKRVFGRIESGDWDLHKKILYVSRHPFFECSVKEHINHGTPWVQTRHYQHQLDNNQLYDIAKPNSELYYKMLRSGYMTQLDLKTYKLWDEILVCIDRDGEIIFVNGIHRLTYARMLGLSEIPVLVCARHEEWIKLKRTIKNLRKNCKYFSCKLILHPDIAE